MHCSTLLVVAGIAAGIIIGSVSPRASELGVAALIIAGVQLAIFLLSKKGGTHSLHNAARDTQGLALSFFTTLLLASFFVGIVRAQLVREKIAFTCETRCEYQATIVSSPEKKDAHQTFVVRADGAASFETYDVLVRTSLYPEYEIGDTLSLAGVVKVPSEMFPHGDEKSFDYVSYLRTKDVGSQMLFPKIEKQGSVEAGVATTLTRWKTSLVSKLHMHLSSPASDLANGMLFGEFSMSKDISDAFRVAGLSHIVVLSGFNIAIVISFILFVFALVPLLLRVLLASSFVFLFVLMVGGEASVVRATLMSFVGLLAMLVGREYVARQALLLSFLVIILYDPVALLYSVSLHLSFLATAGIVYWSGPIKKMVEKYISRTSTIEMVTTTLAAYLATLPYTMYAFGTISVYALLANVLVLPLVPLAMLLSFFVLIASFVYSPLALVIGYAGTALLDVIIFVATAVSALPGAQLVFTVSFATMFVLYGVCAASLLYFSRRKKNETPLTSEEGHLTGIVSY